MNPARNDPCHCGSGRKYKHCHYPIDQAPPEQKYRAAQEVYAKNWVIAARSHYDDQLYHWMAQQIAPFKPARLLDVGCGSGHGLLALFEVFGHQLEIVSIDENRACLDVAHSTLTEAGIDVSIVKRLQTALTPDGFIQEGTKIEAIPKTRCTLIESDLCNDEFLENALINSGKFDAVTIWLTGTHMMRPNHAMVRRMQISSDGRHRLYVQNKVYELADRILNAGGVLQVVDRGEEPASDILREDILSAHRDQASVTSLHVKDLQHRPYESPAGTRVPTVITPGISGRVPSDKTALISIISVKP